MWSQNYSPLPGVIPSALLSALPVLSLLFMLGAANMRAHKAAAVSLGIAVALAVAGFGMPVPLALAAAGFGAVFGLFPIGWIVLNAMFIYQISVETGQFEALKAQIARISDDQRIQTLIIAFCFGAFIEGCAGFGAPVAITAAMLIGVGFKPLESATLALIGNTAPVAFGSVGIPITTLHSITGLDLHQLSAMTGRQLPFFSLLIPFWLVGVKAGFRGMLQVWPACLTCGASFAFTQFAVSNYHGPWLVDTASALCAMFALGVQLKFGGASGRKMPESTNLFSGFSMKALKPWLPWILLSLFVALWSIPGWRNWLNSLSSPRFALPWLHLGIQKMPPVAAAPEPEKAEFIFNWLSATGTALLFAGVCAGSALGIPFRGMSVIYRRTFLRLRVSLVTIVLMLAIGFTTRYSGTDTVIGLAFAETGTWFPFFSPLLGWLGVALTGSDTSSNVLFGNLQKTTAQQIDVSPILTCAANTSGGVMGKMIDAQSIVVAGTATSGSGMEVDAGTILRSVFFHSLVLALLVGVLVWMQAYLLPWMLPG
jgi:lactate permease